MTEHPPEAPPDAPAGQPPLATCSFKTYTRDMGVAVRITVGRPRFFRHPYEFVAALAPFGIFNAPEFEGKPMDVKEAAFYRRLDSKREEVLAALGALADAHPGRTLVLLCYEDVHAGDACHRTWAANWFADRLGWDVPEVSPAPEPRLF
ncbi:hypothetical protein F5972_08410 [Microbispora cellulosiformans]|uniref:DUF488 domain-containing protein n=1 Tax=Microbispora cellulosiformans TaxID=2614688 RepID=A0A5J5K4Y9_9ACTN|nr:hypothetical protein [Microbispora cellulosiformans]KAA9379665.1 hypothetical protein F5972_08410 [Microbispora cellulosiformans]